MSGDGSARSISSVDALRACLSRMEECESDSAEELCGAEEARAVTAAAAEAEAALPSLSATATGGQNNLTDHRADQPAVSASSSCSSVSGSSRVASSSSPSLFLSVVGKRHRSSIRRGSEKRRHFPPLSVEGGAAAGDGDGGEGKRDERAGPPQPHREEDVLRWVDEVDPEGVLLTEQLVRDFSSGGT